MRNIRADVLAEVEAEMDFTDEQWPGGHPDDESVPSFEDYLADIERRFNVMLHGNGLS
jgi:hypothetical protein